MAGSPPPSVSAPATARVAARAASASRLRASSKAPATPGGDHHAPPSHRPTLATQAERHAGAVRYAVDRFDRKTAIRVAKDFEKTLIAATADLKARARGRDGDGDAVGPTLVRPPAPPKKKPAFLGCGAGCFL